MTENEKQEMIRRFEDFKKQLPPQIRLEKAGPNGEDVVLPKKMIDGVPVYSAEVDVPFGGFADEEANPAKECFFTNSITSIFQFFGRSKR